MIECQDCLYWDQTEEARGNCLHPLQPKDVTEATDGCGHGQPKEES